MATVADLKEEIPEKKIQAEQEETDGEFQHPNVTSSDDIGEMVDATVTDSNIITKDTVTEDTLDADHVKLPGEPKGEILCKTPQLVQDSSEEAGQKETDLQETEIEMSKEKQACTLKDGLDKDTSADVPVKIRIESNHEIILASQDMEHVKIAASSISSRDCQETEAVTTVESVKEEVQRSNVIEEILPSEDNRLKNGSIIDSELEKEGNVSDSMVNLMTMVTTEQREYKSVVEEDSIVKTDDPSAIQHIKRSQDDANKKDEREAYTVETVDEVRKNQIAIPSTLETKDNQVAIPSEIIEIKVPQNSEMASNFQASIEDDQQKDQYVNDINDTAVETGASGEQMLEKPYATKDVKVKADAECSNMKESASADKSGSTEAVSDENFETSITTISIEKNLTDRSTSYSEDNFPKAVESNQGKTAAGDELKYKEDFDILLVSESVAGENFQVERTQDLAEVASMKEKEKPEAVAEVSYIVIDEKEKTDEALPSTESTEEKTCQLNETSIFKDVDESSSSEPSVPSNIKKDEKEDDIHKEELVEDRNIHANLHRDDHEDEKLDRTLDTCETVGDDAGAMHPENTHGEIKNDQFKAVESETNDTNKDKAKAEEAEAAYTESENAPSQEVSSSSINDHHEAMIQDNNISIPGEDQIFSSHKLDEKIGDVKDSQDQEISREDCEKEYQNLNRKITGNQHADAELVTQDSADKICNNSQETQLENLDKVPDTRSKNQSHEKTCISSVEDGETTCIPSVSGILKNDMQSDIVEETGILRNEKESLNQETLAGERDTYSLPREDENEKGQTGASFNEAFVEKENNSSEAYEEQGTLKNTEESVHGNQDIREKDLIEEEATHASSDKLEDEIDANPSCTSKPFTETIDPEKEVKAIYARNEKILDKTVATVVLTSKPLDGTLAEEKEVENMHVSSEQLPDESVASSFINDESQKEIMEGDKDHLIHSDQSSKTENVLQEIEDDRHFKDDQISITEHLVKEVYPTNVEAESQEADIKSPGSDESAEEQNNNTQKVVPSSDPKLALETIESNQSPKDIAPIEAEDEENTFALQSESTAPSSDFSREQTYQSDKSPVDMTLDPTVEIEIAEGSAEEELPNKECLATTTSDTDIEWKDQTGSLTSEVDTSSLEKKNDHEERKTDIELKGTCNDAHNVDREPCAEEVHITNTEEIILDEDTGLESVKEVDKCIHGDQDNKVKDLTWEEEATYASPSCTSKPLTETIDPEKEVEAIHASSEKILDKTVPTVVLTSKQLDGILEEEMEVETMHAGSEQLPDERVASSIINDESQKEIVEGDKDHLVHSDQSSKTDKVLEEIEDDRHFTDDQISVTENLVKEVHLTKVEAESQEADIRSPGIEESSEELSNNTQEVVPSSDLKLASETTDSDQSSKDIAPIETKDEENTFPSDFPREQTYESNKSTVDMTLDPTGEIEIEEEELLNKECCATITSDTDIVTKDQTESLTCEVETSSLEKKDDHEERETDTELKGTCDDAHTVDGGLCAEEVHITNTEEIILDGDTGLESVKEVDECIHGDQDNKVKDLREEEEATYASGDKLEDDIDASPSCTSKPLTETIDPEKEVEAIHASSEKILDKTVATVVLTSKPLDGTLDEEREVETMHAGSEQLPDESVASSIINDESQNEIVEGDKDHLVHSDQSSKTDKVLEEIEDDRHFTDDQISVTENLVKEVHHTKVEAESQEADIRSPGIEESSEELSNNTQEVVPSSDLKLASETTDSDQSSKDIAPIETKDEENTFASDFSREQTYESNKSTVDMTLDPTGEIEIAEEELLNKECCATTTSDTDTVTKDQTESLTCEVETSSLEKKDDHEERETDTELKGTCDDAHTVDGGLCAEEVHITNTEEIILHGDTGLESVKEVDECINGDQDNKVKDHKEDEEATYASGDMLEDDIDASPSCTSKPLTETIDPEKEVEAIHASSEKILDKTVATVVLTSKPLDGTLDEEREVETMHAGSEQLPDERVASSIINDESQKEIVEGDKNHLVHSDQSSKTDKVLEEIEDDRHFTDDQISVTENLVREVHHTKVEAESQEADIRSPGIEESSEELSNNTQEVVPSSDLKLASETTDSDQSSKDIAPIETKDEENTFASDFSREQTYESNKSTVDMTLDPTGEIEIAEEELLNKECCATTTSDTDTVTKDQTESLTCEVETSSLEKKDDHEERETDTELKGTCDDAHTVDGGLCAEEVHITNTEEIILDGDTGLESVKEVDECINGDQDNKVKDHKEDEEATYASGDKLEDDIDASPSCTSKPLTETIDPEKEVEDIHASSEKILDKTVATVVLTSKPLDGILEEEREVETMHAGSEQLPDESVASSIINDESQKKIAEGDNDHLVHSDQSSKTEKVLEEVEDDKQFKEDQIPGTEHLVKEVHPTNVEAESQKADIRSPGIEESTEELSNNTQEVIHSSDLKLLVKEVHSSEHLVKEVHPTNVEAKSQEADIRSPGIEESTEELSNNTQEVVHSSDLKLLVKEVHSSEHLVKEVHPTNVEAESQEADIRSPGIEESSEELSNNTEEVVYCSDLKVASETTDSDQSSKDIAAIEAEDEENTFALQSESIAPSFDFSREQTNQSNKTPVDMMLDKQCHATTTLDSDIESKDKTESLTCEEETSSFEKKDDHEEREIDIQLKGTCDDVQNVAGGPCAEEVHIKNTEEIILDADTGLESVKQVDVKCTHGDQDMVKDDLKEVEESDHGSIEKSMYEEAFMEDNAFHFSPEKHEEDQFTSAHKAQDEAREKELADYSSKEENIVVKKVHDKGVGSENDPNSRTSTDNEEASRSITYGEKEGDTEKQIESLNPEPGDLPDVQTLFMKSLDLDDQKNDEGVEDPKTSRVEEIINTGDHSTVEDPKEDLENKNVQEILHERDEKETVQTSLDFLVEKEGKNLLGVKVPIKGDMEQPTSMESRESAERVGTGTITKEEFTEFSKDINITALMGEIKGRSQQAMEKDSLNEIDTTKMEGLKVQEFGIAREHSRIESEKVELRKENGNNGNGVGNDDNSKMQEEPEGNPTDEKIDKKFDEKMQNQTERDAQSVRMLHADIVEEYSVIENLNFSEQNVNSVDSVKCKEETKDVEEQHKNMVAVPAFLESATKETFEEKEKPEAAFCAATPSTEGKIIEKEKKEAEVATTELFNTIPTTNNGTSNEKGQRMNVFEGEEKKNSDDSTITKDMIFEEGGCDLKTSPLMDRNETDGDKGDVVEIKMTHEQDLAPLVTAQSNSEVLDCNKLNIAEEKDEGTSKNLSSLSTTEPIEGTICKDRGQEVPEDTSLVHNDDADPNKFMKEEESTVLMASQLIVTEGLLPEEEKVPTPKEEDACTVDNYLPVSQFLLNLIHEEFPDDENTKADNLKQEDIVPKDYIKTETRTEVDNRDSMELPVSNSSLMLEEKKHDFCERAEDGNAEGMEEFKKLSDSPNKREIDKDTNDDNFLLSEFAESRHGDLKILNDGAKEELTIVSESGIEEDMSSTHPSYDEKIYEQKTPEEHAIECRLDKNIDVQEVDSKDEEILKQESNDSEDKIEIQLDNEMINEAGLENKASAVIQPEEIKELEDSINNKGTLPNTQGVEQTKESHSEIYVDDLQLRSTDTVEKIKEEVAEDQTTKMETLSTGEKEPHKNLDAVEQKNSSEDIIICVDPKEVQSNVETVDKATEDQKAFSLIKSAEVKYAESLVAREIEEVLSEVKTLPVTELAEATDPECIPTCNIVERDTDKKSTATTNEECLTTIETVEKVKEEDETSTTIKSGVKDAENFNGSEETAQSNQFQVAEVLGYVVVQGQKQGEIFENESEFVKETEKEEKAQMNINIKESSSGDSKKSYLSMENQTDMQKRAVEDKNQNAESYLERKEIKDSTVKEEKIEEAKNESSGQNVTEESDHETAPLIEMKEGKHSPPNKKHGNILSGVRSKVKQSISSVKKAITCSSSVSHLIHEGN